VVLQILLFRWLFQPIAKVMDELKNIQKGKQADFEGIYPQEVSVLTRSLNDFLKAEQRQIQRIKDSLGNLAHSLKTPLAAMRGELSDEKFNKVLFEQQVERIATVVDYQLNRTSTSMRPSYRQAQKCYDSVNRLVLVMRRLHEDKGILIHAEMDEDIVFFGDLDDLTEIIGNILENACKWAKSQVTIRLENQAMNKLYITILDDGPGVPDDKVEEILTRGRRLDMNSEGQGIGLAMVNDLVDSYSGSLSFESVKDHHSDFESGLTVIILI
jgi:two-component system sensor histidine kinase PhoQ